jgi:hypothetical protein
VTYQNTPEKAKDSHAIKAVLSVKTAFTYRSFTQQGLLKEPQTLPAIVRYSSYLQYIKPLI